MIKCFLIDFFWEFHVKYFYHIQTLSLISTPALSLPHLQVSLPKAQDSCRRGVRRIVRVRGGGWRQGNLSGHHRVVAIWTHSTCDSVYNACASLVQTNHSIDGRCGQGTLALAEFLLAIVSCWDGESHFSLGVWHWIGWTGSKGYILGNI